MNLVSSRLSWLLLALIVLQMLAPAHCGFNDFFKVFDKKKNDNNNNNNNNNKQADNSRASQARQDDVGENLRDTRKRTKADEQVDLQLDAQLEQANEAKQHVRVRVDLAKIRAAAAEAERIAAAAGATSEPAAVQPQPDDDSDDEYDAYDDQKKLPKPPTTIGRRRKPSTDPKRYVMPETDYGYDSGASTGDESDEDVESQPRWRAAKGGQQANENRLVATGVATSDQAIDRDELRPVIRARPKSPSASSAAAKFFGKNSGKTKSKLFSASYLKKKVSKGVKQVGAVISEIPHLVEQATDTVSAMLQLDSKGRLLALIEEVNGDIHFVKREFSKFSITWSPIMEKALNYLGDTDLDKLKYKEDDELDFRSDALHSLVFGYEFMRLMMGWRENMLVAHEAYKLYLEGLKVNVTAGNLTVDEDFIFQTKTDHAYMLMSSWLDVDKIAMEPRMKLDHLMMVEDDRPKNYESEYFRNIIIMQELYDPVLLEFKQEREQVEGAIAHSGALTEDFEKVEEFFDEFKNKLAENQVKGIDWEAPEELHDFMKKIRPQLQYNPVVYSRSFKKEILQALREQAAENDH